MEAGVGMDHFCLEVEAASIEGVIEGLRAVGIDLKADKVLDQAAGKGSM